MDEQLHTVQDQAATRSQLAKIVSSPPFVRSSRISDFLTFIVENTLDGQEDVLKESCIGSSVFGRDPGYDPKIDPIVRVEARRLRDKLQEFYETEGVSDSILIQVPKGGYRAVIEVRVLPEPAPPTLQPTSPLLSVEATTPIPAATSTPLPPDTAAPASAVSQRRQALPLLVIAIVVLVGTVLWLVFRRPAAVHEARFAPLTSYIGHEFGPAISPDGHHLAFAWDGDGSNYDIYVKPLVNGDPVRLTTNPAHDLHPAWSPDGRDIAFLRLSTIGAEVITVPSTGGPEREIGALRSPIILWKADASQIAGSLGPTWSPDGRALVVSDNGAIFLWPLAYGERRRLTAPPAGSNDLYPAISPDGSTLALVRQTSNSTADVYTISLTQPNAEAQRVTHDTTDIRGITWASDSKSIVLSSYRNGNYALWRLFLDGDRMEPVATHSTQAADPSLALKSDMLAYTELTQNTNIWRLRLGKADAGKSDSDKSTPLTRLISSSRRNNSPQYSPDGQQIAFISDRSGSWELWLAHADGSSQHALTSFHGPLLGTPHWSPDGQRIAFDARPGDHSGIFLIPSAGGAPKRLSQGDFEERMPTWSRDGHFLYFNSNRDGSVRMWRMTPDGGNLSPISTHAAYDSFVSQDGSTLYFRSDNAGIWQVPAAGGTEKLVPQLATVGLNRYLALAGDSLYFVDREDTPRQIKAYDLTTHKVRVVGQIDGNLVGGTPSLSVSADEHFLLFAQQDESSSDILSVPWGDR